MKCQVFHDLGDYLSYTTMKQDLFGKEVGYQ